MRQGQGGQQVAEGDRVSNDDDRMTRDRDKNNHRDKEDDDNDNRTMMVRMVRNGSQGSRQ